ncbi:hypothetical protein EVAR_10930_1 [Eumeta japonica]|uniref:Uncharacterized protein n=1 Tax=Eumeta variegata TaxID=151549 RepID=A0A4C1U5T6_EUMVA|nr:hypothetical protein EVAR_10930_1 [Eumeta japonica]
MTDLFTFHTGRRVSLGDEQFALGVRATFHTRNITAGVQNVLYLLAVTATCSVRPGTPRRQAYTQIGIAVCRLYLIYCLPQPPPLSGAPGLTQLPPLAGRVPSAT